MAVGFCMVVVYSGFLPVLYCSAEMQNDEFISDGYLVCFPFCRDLFSGETVNCLNAIYPCRKVLLLCVSIFRNSRYFWLLPSVLKGSHIVVVFEEIRTIFG
jgi:hypothetical protein